MSTPINYYSIICKTKIYILYTRIVNSIFIFKIKLQLYFDIETFPDG